MLHNHDSLTSSHAPLPLFKKGPCLCTKYFFIFYTIVDTWWTTFILCLIFVLLIMTGLIFLLPTLVSWFLNESPVLICLSVVVPPLSVSSLCLCLSSALTHTHVRAQTCMHAHTHWSNPSVENSVFSMWEFWPNICQAPVCNATFFSPSQARFSCRLWVTLLLLLSHADTKKEITHS